MSLPPKTEPPPAAHASQPPPPPALSQPTTHASPQLPAQASGSKVPISNIHGRGVQRRRESPMNCRSCRKRKIKCSRTRPSCNACEVFRCECVYDAVPKKRGPKTEVLEELLKRIDGLEKRLETEGSSGKGKDVEAEGQQQQQPEELSPADRMMTIDSPELLEVPPPRASSTESSKTSDLLFVEKLIDVYFCRVNGKPYSIFHEDTFRREYMARRVPWHCINAICAMSVRYCPDISPKAAQVYSEEFGALARKEVDSDEPTLHNLQTMLLLSLNYYAMGYGKKSFMQMGSAIRMTLALDLHRELPQNSLATPLEREIRRRVFWACYLMDRFTVVGSNRPPLFSDRSILLRLPCPEDSFLRGAPQDTPFFSESGQLSGLAVNNNNNALLVDIVRILGRTIRYTQSGGVRGDSHFPWHSASNLSRIRNELNAWASLRDLRAGVPPRPDATSLFLARGVWHVIHCLMYRNFLPIELTELDGNGTQQAWQTEATKVCFQHANALVDLIAVAAMTPAIEWPAFMGFCLLSAATVLVHGVFYRGSEAFRRCRENLAKILGQMKILQSTWACMRQQFATLKKLYRCHEKLVQSFCTDRPPQATVFHLDDFFDRYHGESFEACHVPFFEIPSGGQEEMDLSFIDTIQPLPLHHQQRTYHRLATPTQPKPEPSYQPQQPISPSSVISSAMPYTPQHIAPSPSLVDVYSFENVSPQQPTQNIDAQGFLTSAGGQQVFDPTPAFDFVETYDMFGQPQQGGHHSQQTQQQQVEQERDPLLSMLAEMAERDEGGGAGGPGGGPSGGGGGGGGRALDVWMGGG